MDYKKLTKEQLDYLFRGLINFKTEPMLHQLQTLAWGIEKNRVMLWSDIGTGKSFVALYLSILWGCKKILIVCPNSVMQSWESEIKLHTDFNCSLLDGTTEEAKNSILKNNSGIVVVNYEKLKYLFAERVKGVGFKLSKFSEGFSWFSKLGYDCLIVDECHAVKSVMTKQTRILYHLSRIMDKVILMTGTPVAKDERDLWSEFHVLDLGKRLGKSYSVFLREYFYPIDMGGKFTDYRIKFICPICGDLYSSLRKHLELKHRKIDFRSFRINYPQIKTAKDLILSKVKDITIRYEREECFELPEKSYQVRFVKMTSEQYNWTGRIWKEIKIALEKGKINLTNVLTRIVKLSQVTGGFVLGTDNAGDNVVERFKQNPKLLELQKCLEEISNDIKIIIYHHYSEEGKMIANFLKGQKIKFREARGEIKDKDKQIQEFQTNSDIRVLVAHPSCGGVGLNLQVASVEIFYSNDFSSVLRTQAEGRIYRKGQKNKCLYIDLVCKDSIDEEILNILKQKKDIAKSMLDYIKRGGK